MSILLGFNFLCDPYYEPLPWFMTVSLGMLKCYDNTIEAATKWLASPVDLCK